MPEYDAFGREIGENTLSGLGGSDATSRPQPAPAPTPAPEDARTEAPPPETPVFTTQDVPPQRIRVRRARGLGCLVGLVVLAAVVAGPIIAVVSIVGSASDTIDGVLDDIPTIDPADVAEAPDAPAPPVGIAGRSMIAPDNVSAVLKRLRGDGVKTVGRLVVRTDRTDVVAIQGRRERDIDFGYEGGVERGDARRANQPFGTIAIADLDAKAPARLVRNAAKRYRVRERGIDYLIASHDAFNGTGHRWIAYFKNGIYVQGDERGRVIRRIS